jgi:hypothetical protein
VTPCWELGHHDSGFHGRQSFRHQHPPTPPSSQEPCCHRRLGCFEGGILHCRCHRCSSSADFDPPIPKPCCLLHPASPPFRTTILPDELEPLLVQTVTTEPAMCPLFLPPWPHFHAWAMTSHVLTGSPRQQPCLFAPLCSPKRAYLT